MTETDKHNEKVAKLTFASVYPHYMVKVERKGRTVDELHEVIEWLTGFNFEKVNELIELRDLFDNNF